MYIVNLQDNYSKREEYAVTLRKKKKEDILKQKRNKLVTKSKYSTSSFPTNN